LIIDGLTFIVSAAILRLIEMPRETEKAGRESFFRELRNGFREVQTRGWISSSIAVFAVSNLAFAALSVVGPTIFVQQAGGVLKWGLLLAALNCGTVAGDLLALRWTPNRSLLAARIVEFSQVPLFIFLALNVPPPFTITAAVLAGVGISLPDALWYSTMQEHLSDDVISRVASYDWLGSTALRPIGYSLSVAIASGLGTTYTMLLGGVAILVSRTVGAALPSVRLLDRRNLASTNDVRSSVPN
jgi:hypothetical protein